MDMNSAHSEAFVIYNLWAVFFPFCHSAICALALGMVLLHCK